MKRNLIKFVIFLFIFSIFIGIAIFKVNNIDSKEYVDVFLTTVKTHNINAFWNDFFTLSIIFLLSITVVGCLGTIPILVYEGTSIGFTLALFANHAIVKGTIAYMIFFVMTKLIFIIILIYFEIISLNFGRKILSNVIKKEHEKFALNVFNHFKRYIITVMAILINSALIFALTPLIANVMALML